MKAVFVGKFQMMVLPQSGHAVHEDHPDKVDIFGFNIAVPFCIIL